VRGGFLERQMVGEVREMSILGTGGAGVTRERLFVAAHAAGKLDVCLVTAKACHC